MTEDLGLYTQRRRFAVRDVIERDAIRRDHGIPPEGSTDLADLKAERWPVCRVCFLPESTDHELRVLGPVRADGSDQKAAEWAFTAGRMARRDGRWYDADLYPRDWLHREIEILAARVWHWEDAKREQERAS